jgi:2,3-bisphosphoglycerate-independent phosphoglycerate mutase
MNGKKTLLMILDGWGIGNGTKSDVIATVGAPYIDSLKAKYPNSQLLTDGVNVGLPEGQMGNSEVGHLNIGAGRVVYQDLVKINLDIADGSFFKLPALTEAMEYAKANDKAVHFIGLISDGGVHSVDSHLYALCDMTKNYGLNKVFIHALTDGRDTDPRSGLGFIQNLENHLATSNGQIATILGRYYGMDRDKRWERVKIAYDLMVHGTGTAFTDSVAVMKDSYASDKTDEFVQPHVRVDANGNVVGKIQAGDVVICFNYRTDRLRQTTVVLTQQDMPEHGMATLPLHYVTMTRYDESFSGVITVYDKDNLLNTMGELVSKLGKKQLRIAETEKFAHVTFFFSGGRNDEFQGEERILVQSPKVATYDLQPEMSALIVADKLEAALDTQKYDFICLNYANGDMIGHTGIYEAISKAVKTIDAVVKQSVEAALKNGYEVVIIADHGNADFAVNEDGSPNTAHSLNPVPCIVVSDRFSTVANGRLADVAPTLLKLMGIEQPAEMTGLALV